MQRPIHNLHPVYLDATDVKDGTRWIDGFAWLCQALNQMGTPTYWLGEADTGEFWAPRLTPSIVKAHHRSNAVPVRLVLKKQASPVPKAGIPFLATYRDMETTSPDDAGVTWHTVKFEHETLGDIDLPLPEAAEGKKVQGLLNMPEAAKDNLATFVTDLAQLHDAAEHTLPLAWPQAVLDSLPGLYTEAEDMARRDNRNAMRRWQKQFETWKRRSTIREVDAQIYGEHVAHGRVVPISLVIDQREQPMDWLADTLDSLENCLGKPASIDVLSLVEPPEGVDESRIRWHTLSPQDNWEPMNPLAEWTLVMDAGCELYPQALMEFGLAPSTWPGAHIYYADEEMAIGGEFKAVPLFKPDLNRLWLECSNYLGNTLLVNSATWIEIGCPLHDGGLYAWSLALADAGAKHIGHVDTVLFASKPSQKEGLQAQECAAAQTHAHLHGARLQKLPYWGQWLIEHPAKPEQRISIVIPTGIQTGYLTCLLKSFLEFWDDRIQEIILVRHTDHAAEVDRTYANLNLPIRCIDHQMDEFNYARAVNMGIAACAADFVLVADDDTELVHKNWLSPLLGFFNDPNTGCVSPRLMSNLLKEGHVNGGPVVLGVHSSAISYCGENGLLQESGHMGRLQVSQHTSAINGSFYLIKKEDWLTANKLDEEAFGHQHATLDLCLKLVALGKQHVWTPLVNVLHTNKRTVGYLMAQPAFQVRWLQQEVQEKERLLAKWSHELAHDPFYNRHLSLVNAFELDVDVVIDWQPKRKEKPRILGLPVASGAGMYRVIDPLNALQDQGLAQTCSVMPLENKSVRHITPLELARAAPDTLLLQHSLSEHQQESIKHFRLVCPALFIVQTVDDLFGQVPDEHPSKVLQAREGHHKLVRALAQSDRLIVTTQPLKTHYGQYIRDVVIIPNHLTDNWFELPNVTKPTGTKPRVGWVGAGQHRGDLLKIVDLVKKTQHKYNWIFMGMMIDEIRPYIAEFHQPVSIDAYPEKMNSLALEVAIAPLEDNLFNQCKSNLRLLEYGACGWATVASDVYPYSQSHSPALICVNDEAWEMAIDEAISNYHSLGIAMKKWCTQNHTLRDHAGTYLKTLTIR